MIVRPFPPYNQKVQQPLFGQREEEDQSSIECVHEWSKLMKLMKDRNAIRRIVSGSLSLSFCPITEREHCVKK